MDDLATIKTGGMLTDKHITWASCALKQHFPEVHGLQIPVLAQSLSFERVPSPFVQIMHNKDLVHWVAIATRDSQTVFIYDSLNTTISDEVMLQAACCLQSTSDQVEFRLIRNQKQKGGVDCGLFAIAVATDLCHGHDPASRRYII
jgi:hypothetical protein